MASSTAAPIENLWKDGLLAKIVAPRRQLALLVKLRPFIEGRIISRVVRVAETLSGGEALNSISCATFWSVDPAFGWCMQNTVSVLVTAVATAKIAFRGPRPMWLSKDVSVSEKVMQESLTTYGFPSGHVTGAIVFYGLALGCKLPWVVWVPAVGAMAASVGMARMLALAHLPCDVAGAVPLGLLVLPPCLYLSRKYMDNPRTKHDPVRPSRRIASANIAMGSLLLLVAIRLLKPQHTRWASKDLTLAIGVNIAMGLAHLMLIGQRGLGIYPHQGTLSYVSRAMRLALGLLGQLAGYAILRVARTRSLNVVGGADSKNLWISEVALFPTIYGCLASWGTWVVPTLVPAKRTTPNKVMAQQDMLDCSQSWQFLGNFFGRESPERKGSPLKHGRYGSYENLRTSDDAVSFMNDWISPRSIRQVIEEKDLKIEKLEEAKKQLEAELVVSKSRHGTPAGTPSGGSPHLSPSGFPKSGELLLTEPALALPDGGRRRTE